MKRLRLVKVVIQPMFVIDDGDTLTDAPAQPYEVAAADWPGIVSKLEADRASTEERMNAETEPSP